MNDLEELTDEERMMNLLEELQQENDKLKSQQTAIEPLLQTIRQQEQEIMRLNSSLIEERKQNEKLLELAKNEKKLHEENMKLKRENGSLQLNAKKLQELWNPGSHIPRRPRGHGTVPLQHLGRNPQNVLLDPVGVADDSALVDLRAAGNCRQRRANAAAGEAFGGDKGLPFQLFQNLTAQTRHGSSP